MRIFLAPMEGVVDHHLRRIYAEIGGVDICVTEFIRVTHTQLPAKVFKKYCPELAAPIKIPVRVQLLGSNPELLAFNAHRVAMLGASAVDLNFGCPAKTVNRHRGGACLLNETNLLFDIVKAVREAVPDNVPVTAKIRLGYENRSNYVENAQAIAEAGAAELFVHGRSKEDGYKPPAYWGCIGEIRDALSIPVVANGEIWTVDDFLQCQQESGCEDFMLGRGLLARPDLGLAIKAKTKGKEHNSMPWSDVLELLHRFHLDTLPDYPPKFCGNRLKQWLMYLKRQYPEASVFFERVKRLKNEVLIEALFVELIAAE